MTAATFDTLAEPAAKTRRKPPFSKRTAIIVGAAVVVAGTGAALLAAPRSTVSTDAAYLEADSSTIAPKVRGLVAEVLVADNQPVTKGQPLLRLDGEEFTARAAAAEAALQNARAAASAADAELAALAADQQLAAAQSRAAQTSITAAQAQSDQARADRDRFDSLAAQGFVSRQDAGRYRAAAVSAQSAADRSRAELDVSRNQATVVSARRASLVAAQAQAQAAVAQAQAALDLARQDQVHTVIRAPIAGVVGNRHAQPGDYVQPGAQLMTVVPMGALYVTANFKETQVARMVTGQAATLKIDALPGEKITGRVESFAPGSGSRFSLLPFEPGTGNFTKIVQRVPVRIRLDPNQPALARLRPGLSATVKVALK